MATLTAPAVSRTLRAAGFGIVATRNREGIRVSKGALPGYVSVTVDLDRDGEARRLAETLGDWLSDIGPWTFRQDGLTFTVALAGTRLWDEAAK